MAEPEETTEFQEPELHLDSLFADDTSCEWPLRACPNVELSCDQCPYQRETY